MARPVARDAKSKAKNLLGKSRLVKVEPTVRGQSMTIERARGMIRLAHLNLRQGKRRKGQMVFPVTIYIWMPFRSEPYVSSKELISDVQTGALSETPITGLANIAKVGWQATGNLASADDLLALAAMLETAKVTLRK